LDNDSYLTHICSAPVTGFCAWLCFTAGQTSPSSPCLLQSAALLALAFPTNRTDTSAELYLKFSSFLPQFDSGSNHILALTLPLIKGEWMQDHLGVFKQVQ